jgi:predicted metal-dependent phosphoesterase TrpH
MIDLHVHSTASDGTVSPSGLAAKGSGFSLMAITDHDNCDGVEEFLAACAGLDSESEGKVRLAGIELSVEPGDLLALVARTQKGILAKKDGITGWYRGRYTTERNKIFYAGISPLVP